MAAPRLGSAPRQSAQDAADQLIAGLPQHARPDAPGFAAQAACGVLDEAVGGGLALAIGWLGWLLLVLVRQQQALIDDRAAREAQPAP